MKKFYLIHGFEGAPNGGWRPWLMQELYKNNIFAVSLAMPNPEKPILAEWIKKIKSEVAEVNGNTYFVGHSLAVSAILKYLETLPDNSKIGGVFSVAGFIEKLETENPNSAFRPIDNFLEEPFDFERIKKVCQNFTVIQGDRDEYVSISNAKFLAEKLNIEPLIIKDIGHFSDSKVFELPELLKLITND